MSISQIIVMCKEETRRKGDRRRRSTPALSSQRPAVPYVTVHIASRRRGTSYKRAGLSKDARGRRGGGVRVKGESRDEGKKSRREGREGRTQRWSARCCGRLAGLECGEQAALEHDRRWLLLTDAAVHRAPSADVCCHSSRTFSAPQIGRRAATDRRTGTGAS